MPRQAVRLLISGRVQGVGFRWWLVGEAMGLGVAGWVRNLRDGRVEALALGGAEALERLAAACESGPPGARIDAVERMAAEDDGSAGFEQRPTA
jgi:acylphosphatase